MAGLSHLKNFLHLSVSRKPALPLSSALRIMIYVKRLCNVKHSF